MDRSSLPSFGAAATPRGAPLLRAGALLGCLTIAACSGSISDAGGTPSDRPSGPGRPSDPDAPIELSTFGDLELYSRHTKPEYRYMITDLLEGADAALQTAALRQIDGFSDNNYAGYYQNHTFLNAEPRLAGTQLELARALTRGFMTSTLYRELCGSGSCGANVIERLLPRIWKRAIPRSEQAELLVFLESLPEDRREELFFLRVFASPYFHFEVFARTPDSERERAIKHANMLSFAITGSFVDEELQADLESGALDDGTAWEPHIRRMLESHPDRFAILFIPQWLGMSSLYESPDTYGGVAMRAVMSEPARIFADLLADGEDIAPLVALEFNVVNPRLAGLYGLPTEGIDGWVQREATSTLFGTAAMSTMFVEHETGFPNPIRRGSYIVNRLLCRDIRFPSSAVQSEIDRILETIPEGLSPPERMAYLRTHDTCATCHEQFDHYGLALEEIGALGETLTTYYTGDPIEAAGEVGDLTYTSSVDFAQQLSRTQELHTCFASQVHSYFSGSSHVEANRQLRRIADDLHELPIADVIVQMATLSIQDGRDE